MHTKKISSENNFIYLFIALTGLLLSTALLQEIKADWKEALYSLVFFGVFVLSVHSIRSERTWMWAVYFFSFLIVLLYLFHQFFTASVADFLHLLILFLFFAGTFKISYKQILLQNNINRNMIVGSIVLYLLLGLIWTVFYLLLLMVYPDAFSGLEVIVWQDNFAQVAYFSFVTLTTLGYGDISPANRVSEFFVYAEAIVGLFYMAIIVASLVSARLAQEQKDGASSE